MKAKFKCPQCGSTNIKQRFDGKQFCGDCGASGDELLARNLTEQTEQDITALSCPQCGSTAVSKRRDGLYYCDFCGAKILVHDDQLDGDEKGKESVLYGRINPTVTEQEFLRDALIELATNADSPTDIFDAKFETVKNEEIKVLVNEVTADAFYTVTIGTNRTEEYTVMEKKDVKYYKYGNRPATSSEINKGEYVTVRVDTPVVKTRTVTDWTPFSGTSTRLHSIKAGLFIGKRANPNAEGVSDIVRDKAEFSREFMDAYQGIDASKEILPVNNDENKALQFSKTTIKEIEKLNAEDMKSEIEQSLPGDTHRDLRCDFSNDRAIRTALLCNQYTLKYQYGEETYDTYAFPFGNTELHHQNGMEAGKSEKENMLWRATFKISLLATLLLVASIAISILIRNVAAVGIGFGAALGLYIFDRINVKRNKHKLECETEQVKLEELNKKLTELGLEKYEA